MDLSMKLTLRSLPPQEREDSDVWRYANPVRILFGAGSFDEVAGLIAGRRHVLVTYPDAFAARLRARLEARAGTPLAVIDDVAPNPDYAGLAAQVARLGALPAAPEVIVALGGGSVIDSAKVFAAAGGDFGRVRRYLETGAGAETLDAVPIIAIPTTAGTGSEVTSWATVWDAAGGRKHSLARPGLYPEAAVIDPELMLSLPEGLTVSTGLDALSHALESIWNRNANPVSLNFAVRAAQEILEVLPALRRNLGDLVLRSRMAEAALFAGLAFSGTKTAIAHSISYPVTLRYDVVHGIACSFTLPMILRSLAGDDGPHVHGLARVFGEPPRPAADRLERFLHEVGVATDPAAYGIGGNAMPELVAAAFDGERGQNFVGGRAALLRELDAATAS
jgi:phosphonate metabolism-associated iron-containing alcohol dehydrogenase